MICTRQLGKEGGAMKQFVFFMTIIFPLYICLPISKITITETIPIYQSKIIKTVFRNLGRQNVKMLVSFSTY